jgi:hypothetical protein
MWLRSTGVLSLLRGFREKRYSTGVARVDRFSVLVPMKRWLELPERGEIEMKYTQKLLVNTIAMLPPLSTRADTQKMTVDALQMQCPSLSNIKT